MLSPEVGGMMPYSYNPGGGDFMGMDFDSFATDNRQHSYAGGSVETW